ncbi:MAG: hypothetical protein MZU91_11400 [Desulfosudis oleivorans]|nr:hypothetical protein [Desulfosudis oleivorans]
MWTMKAPGAPSRLPDDLLHPLLRVDARPDDDLDPAPRGTATRRRGQGLRGRAAGPVGGDEDPVRLFPGGRTASRPACPDDSASPRLKAELPAAGLFPEVSGSRGYWVLKPRMAR